ncbi:hypothetical protein ES754_05835 [Psychrobacter frigidicola]|uniref:Glycosyl transferase family 28 C-terminal domain-containing protein n=1 Tax=Psychrobacter frigidicola TaxID=45611 RepID=A0A5C7AC91_9GAMM|nr:hypothetical protein [Psychrobacter frigidicola]TXD98433.1 hypothetical protein ES754_05835 [Psychrobacter frigidicola]
MRIGYYAHHHGSGHCRQADKLAALLPVELQSQLTVFTNLAADAYTFTTITESQIVRLNAEDERPDDVLPGRAGQYWQPNSMHYSPVGNSDIQTRSWQILDGIKQRQIDIMIIDVSAEVAMLCRAASVPYLYVRLAGIRDDSAHVSAFTGALGLLAPYPQALEALMTPDWMRQKTLYLDFLPAANSKPLTYEVFIQLLRTSTSNTANERFDNAEQITSSKVTPINEDKRQPMIITVIKGYGGHETIDAKFPELRNALPDAFIISLGPISDDMREFVDLATQVDDVTPFIAHSDWLLMACGLNGIAQAYDYATPLVVLPDHRPHQEQEVMAEALIAQGRALSWEQFMGQIVEGHIQNLSPTHDNNDSLNIENGNKNTILTNSAYSLTQDSMAKIFIISVATYPLAKSWFQEWLLPQLGLSPEI